MFAPATQVPPSAGTPNIVLPQQCEKLFGSFATDALRSKEANGFLELIERKAIQLFENGQLVFFDASTSNNQCHLVAYRVALLYQTHLKKQDYKMGTRFLVLCFLLSTCFKRNKKLLSDLLIPESTESKKSLNKFINLKDVESAAKQTLVLEIHQFVIDSLKRVNSQENSAVIHELAEMAEENDRIDGIITYPKFAGVLLMDKLAEEAQFSFTKKVKLVCQRGVHTSIYSFHQGTDAPEKAPHILIEGFASLGGRPQDYLDARRQCPNGLFSTSDAKKNHAADCHGCTPCPEDNCTKPALHEEVFIGLNLSPLAILKAAGADFTKQVQPGLFAKYFDPAKDNPKYPELRKLFAEHIEAAQTMGLSLETGKNFVIEHCYPDLGKYALTGKRLLDTTPEEVIRQRGLL